MAARIPIEHFRGPVMLLSGGDDQLWPSKAYADRIMASLAGKPAPHQHLNHPAAGHLVFGLPYEPTPREGKTSSYLLDLGGSPAGNEAAHQSAWPAVLSFVATQ